MRRVEGAEVHDSSGQSPQEALNHYIVFLLSPILPQTRKLTDVPKCLAFCGTEFVAPHTRLPQTRGGPQVARQMPGSMVPRQCVSNGTLTGQGAVNFWYSLRYSSFLTRQVWQE